MPASEVRRLVAASRLQSASGCRSALRKTVGVEWRRVGGERVGEGRVSLRREIALASEIEPGGGEE
jgi:hypothetical protein